MKITWRGIGDPIHYFLIFNAIVVVITVVFVQRKRPGSVLIWTMAFLIFPLVFVLVFYLLLGRDYRNQRMFRNKADVDRNVARASQELKGGYFVSEFSKMPDPASQSLATSNLTLPATMSIIPSCRTDLPVEISIPRRDEFELGGSMTVKELVISAYHHP